MRARRTLPAGVKNGSLGKGRFSKCRGSRLPASRWGVRAEPKLWFPVRESFAKVMSAENRELLRVIVERPPGSLDELPIRYQAER